MLQNSCKVLIKMAEDTYMGNWEKKKPTDRGFLTTPCVTIGSGPTLQFLIFMHQTISTMSFSSPWILSPKKHMGVERKTTHPHDFWAA